MEGYKKTREEHDNSQQSTACGLFGGILKRDLIRLDRLRYTSPVVLPSRTTEQCRASRLRGGATDVALCGTDLFLVGHTANSTTCIITSIVFGIAILDPTHNSSRPATHTTC